jgi:hypothetical protein
MYDVRGLSLAEKFEERYIPEPNSGCWLWIGAIRTGGYGTFYDGEKTVGAHQFSWMVSQGVECVPDKMDVCHTCDNPSCVNPDHLWLGSRSDNMFDASRKNRLSYRMHFNSMKTHCPQGHSYEGRNLRYNSKGRICISCERVYKARKRASIRALDTGKVGEGK